MGRRAEEGQEAPLPQEVSEALDDLLAAFGLVKFPNQAMVVLADLALCEYRLATRSIDRKHWHGQLVSVARACQEFGQGGDESGTPRGDDFAVVNHEDGNERPNEGQRREQAGDD